MPTPPSVEDVSAYLGSEHSWTPAEVAESYAAELEAQRAAIRFPPDPEPPADPLPYSADRAEALKRRVAHNLALRSLPLGVSANLTEMAVATTKVGGEDAEVKRLEKPYRKLVMG